MDENIKREIELYISKYPPAMKLFKELIQVGDVYIMGGLLREYKDNNYIRELRDADFSVKIKDQEKWIQLIKKIPNTMNRFGGYKFKYNGFIIDVWNVRETWAFRNKILDVSDDKFFEYLPKSVFLNIDALTYDLSNNRWNDAIYKQAMLQREIDVVLEDNPFVELNLLRAMILRRKYKMRYSAKIAQIILNCYTSKCDFVNELLDIQFKRYGYSVLTENIIKEEIDLCKDVIF